MTTTQLNDSRDVLEQDLQRDPGFRRFWERTAPARAIANTLISYRIEHDLTQAQLAERLGVRQPRIARLETGEHNPTWNTLWFLAEKLRLSFFFGIAPDRPETEPEAPILSWAKLLPSGGDALVEDVPSPATGTHAVVGVKVVKTQVKP